MSSTPAAEARRPVRRALDLDASPTEVLRGLRRHARVVALVGSGWQHGEALIAVDPVYELDPAAPFDVEPPVPVDHDQTGAFGGGWLGWWGYRLGGLIEDVPEQPVRPAPQPDAVVGYFDRVLRRSGGRWWAEGLVTEAELDDWIATLAVQIAGPAAITARQLCSVGPLTPVPSPDEHRAAVARTIEYIEAGDIFQANLCLRLQGRLTGEPLDLFCAGVEALAPAYGAYVGWPTGAVVSFSPELFIRRSGAEVLTSPIKGTAALTTDPADLAASGKDRAENVMIVDLMRNDLGRVCVPGSVRVPTIARAERHAVWHLVSDVVGRLAPGVTDGDLLRATFPPGSVTGAPKVRALEICAELEATAREAYTGAIGHIGGGGGLELNVAIRTFETAKRGARDHSLWLGVGGGIVADSTPDGEFAECLVKAQPLVDAVGGRIEGVGEAAVGPGPAPRLAQARRRGDAVYDTVLVVDDRPINLEAHLARLDASVRALHGTTVRAGLDAAVRRKVRGLVGRHRLRLDAEPTGAASDGGREVAVRFTLTPLDPDRGPWVLEPRLVDGGWGEHKWSERAEFGAPTLGHDLLLLDTDGSVLETARASVFCVLDDGVHTPPLDGRILPGTMRARVIDALTGAGLPVHQHRLTTADLAAAGEVFVANSLRGVVPVSEIAGVGRWASGPVAASLGALPGTDPIPSAPAWSLAAPNETARVLFIDNYDSFVYNLVQYVGELGGSTTVVRNDRVDLEAVVAARAAGDLTHVVLSPGPGGPADAGACAEIVRRLGPNTPILGVCLGHQVIAEVYGARVVRAERPVHGKPSLVHHGGEGVFAGLPSPFTAARYHSLLVDPATVPPEVEVTARTAGGVIMGLRHRSHPVEGVQFHPESILTGPGHALLARFLGL